jgi:hypothetical protein
MRSAPAERPYQSPAAGVRKESRLMSVNYEQLVADRAEHLAKHPSQMTIHEAQQHQPWMVPYGEHKWWVVNNEGRLKHCILHAQKSLGKIATVAENLDHAERGWLTDDELSEVGDLAADLVSAALQIGTVVGRGIAHALARRVLEKNGKLLDPHGGWYGRAIICT